MPAEGKSKLEILATTAQVLSVVVGVVISVLSFNAAREKDSESRRFEAEARRVEAIKPFLTLRQNVYTEAVKAAAILANPEVFSEEERAEARKRFRALYVAELSMVESEQVASQMVALASTIDPELRKFTPAQKAAYDLSHALRYTYVASWASGTK